MLLLGHKRILTRKLNAYLLVKLPVASCNVTINRRHRSSNARPYAITIPGHVHDDGTPIVYKPAITEVPDEDDMELEEEKGGEPDPRFILSKRLLNMGRSLYKHIDPFPDWFLEKKELISSHRTAAQVRRCLRDWMTKVDRETNSKFRDKTLGWKVGPINPETAAKIYAYGPEETVAYSHFFMPARFTVTRKIFADIKKVLPSFKPSRVVDFGCGPATGNHSILFNITQ